MSTIIEGRTISEAPAHVMPRLVRKFTLAGTIAAKLIINFCFFTSPPTQASELTPGVRDEDHQALPLTFVKLFGGFQFVLIILYALCTEYDENTSLDAKHATGGEEMVSGKYGMWQDIHVMIFVGFGFLMTFLKSYGFSSLVLNFLVGVVAIMWGMLTSGFFHSVWKAGGVAADMHKVPLHLTQLVEGDFAAATALISLGAVLGKTTPTQALVMVVVELVFYSINFQIIVTTLGAADIGGTLAIHTFGAYFGLAFSWMLTMGSGRHAAASLKDHPLNSSVYHSDMFSMVGTSSSCLVLLPAQLLPTLCFLHSLLLTKRHRPLSLLGVHARRWAHYFCGASGRASSPCSPRATPRTAQWCTPSSPSAPRASPAAW